MVQNIGPKDVDIVVKFGAGLHTRPPEDEIADNEAADGHNFEIDVENSDLRPRAPFDLLGTAPNNGAIRGGGSFRLANSSVAAFFQANDTVYAWDGASFDASPVLDTVSTNARLRGHWRSHNWELDGLLLISDLGLAEPVKEWNGTGIFADVGFRSSPSTPFPTAVSCKYISVVDERAVYAHIKDGSTTLGHMIVGSERSDYEEISVSNRPASSLGEADPFFLLTPDLRKINGFVEAFGTAILSSQFGKLFRLEGASAKDFAFKDFYPGSFASGDESVAYIGNDIIYGRQGRIERVSDTDRFGDTAADDLTKGILDRVKAFTGWTTVYNGRLNRIYLFPTDQQEVWVFDNAMLGGEISPWMRWKTKHTLAFQPTFVMSMLDPGDGLEYVFMGDESGKIYRLEGVGSNGDGGTQTIQTQWVSKLFSLPLGAVGNRFTGYIKYRKGDTVEVTVDLLFAGEAVFDEGVTVQIPQSTGGIYYSGDSYYSNDEYYGTALVDRMVRQRIEIPGGDTNEFQVRVTVDSAKSFDVNEIGLRFRGNT